MILARGANTIGAFGLVTGGITILYHETILGLTLPLASFTNHYRRGEGDRVRTHTCGVIMEVVDRVGHARHTIHSGTHGRTAGTLRKGHTVGGRCRKRKRKKSDHGRIAVSEHGGKTGRAMIKYPHIQKNAQRKNTLLYPGLTTVSLDRIINLCNTTMF